MPRQIQLGQGRAAWKIKRIHHYELWFDGHKEDEEPPFDWLEGVYPSYEEACEMVNTLGFIDMVRFNESDMFTGEYLFVTKDMMDNGCDAMERDNFITIAEAVDMREDLRDFPDGLLICHLSPEDVSEGEEAGIYDVVEYRVVEVKG